MDPVIEATGLIKRFGTTTALDRLDLVAEAGQVLAILGPNGAGKTTFVRVLATLLRLDGGQLRVAGYDARRDPGGVRSMIGLAGQYAAVEPTMTGRENLEMVARLFGQGRHQARASATRVLSQIGLTEVAGKLARTYSGGMRRRLDLGASLVGAPRLLLLDEPTSGLDPRSRIELWDAIRGLTGQGTDVLLTTQYLDEADRLADNIVIIDNGRAIAAGTPKDLKQRLGRSVLEVHARDHASLPAVAAVLAQLDHGQPHVAEATRTVTATVAAGIGFAVGFRPHGSALAAVAALALCVVFGFAFEWVFVLAGLAAANAQAAQGISFMVFPLTFVSSAYVPVATMPGWLQAFAANQPITHMVDAVRALTLGPAAQGVIGHPASYFVVRSLLWSAAIIAVTAPLAVARYRKG
jgi:ABC-2 type transport system ATP-binding protein